VSEAELEATYRLGVADVEHAVREAAGLLSFDERRANWADEAAFRRWEAEGHEGERRRSRWDTLRRALAEHGVAVSDSQLDQLRFTVEIADDLKPELAPRPHSLEDPPAAAG
jgi:hypothetical protein